MKWHTVARALMPAVAQAALLVGAAMVDVGLLDGGAYRVVEHLVFAIFGS